VDDVERESVDHGQWSVHDRQTARSSGCLHHTADDESALSTCPHSRRASGQCTCHSSLMYTVSHKKLYTFVSIA